MEALLAFAHELADASGEVLRRHFRRRPLRIETKADRTPVTEVDRAVEELLRERIVAAFPEHGIRGEELGDERTQACHVWVLDPIDGTRSFVAGKPLFGTLIGLLEDDRPVLGVIDHPALNERWGALLGLGARFGEGPAAVRDCPGLEQAIISTTSPHGFRPAAAEAFEDLRRRSRQVVYGCDCYAYGLLASGHLDLVVEERLGLHDWCALVPVIEEAGGRVTDWRGRPLRLRDPVPDQVLAAGCSRLHEAALALFEPHAGQG